MNKREKIFEAGVKLFAEGAYDSVGIREIAREAGVNSAMISYYYKGKVGLLREIFAAFIACIFTVNDETLKKANSLDELCEISVHCFLKSARRQRSLYLIGLRLLNSECQHTADYRDELQERGHADFSQFLDRIGGGNKKSDQFGKMMFSAIMGAIFSDYLLGGGKFIDDDETVEEYSQLIIDMLQPAMQRIYG